MKKISAILFALVILCAGLPERALAVAFPVFPEIPHMPVAFYEFSGICTLDCENDSGPQPEGTVPLGRATLGLIGDISQGLSSENFYSFEYDVNLGVSTVLDMLPILFPALPGGNQPSPFDGVFLDGFIPESGGSANVSLSFPFLDYEQHGNDGGMNVASLLFFESFESGDWEIGICELECLPLSDPDDAGTGGVWTPPASTVPEPASLVLLGIGLVSVAVVSRRRRLS